MPLVGFLPADDPRIKGTVEAIGRDLMVDGLVRRYHTGETHDGLSGSEGVFLACSFWYVDNLAMQGRESEARAMFERLLGLCNDVGLLAEEYDPVEAPTARQFSAGVFSFGADQCGLEPGHLCRAGGAAQPG